MSNTELAILFFLQLTVILGICRLAGFVVKKIGQPQVVGEMIAGVLMGPTLFGVTGSFRDFYTALANVVVP